MKRAFLASLFLVFAIGCKKGPVAVVKDPGPAQLVAGSQLGESSDKLMSIAIPGGWKRGSESSFSMPSLTEMGAGMGGDGMGGGMPPTGPSPDEAADQAAEAAELEKQGILMWVNDSSKPIIGEKRTHFRVKRSEGASTLEDAVEKVKSDLMGEGPVQYVDLPIGKAARLEAKFTKIDGGELFTIVYLILNGDHVYNVRFQTQNGSQSVQQIEKEVINSLRIKPAKG